MAQQKSDTVLQMLHDLRAGDHGVMEALLPQIYDELIGLAKHQRRRWGAHATLNTTALVHEAYLKLVGSEKDDWESRAHFFGVARKAMRSILLDYAKRKRAQKRGGHHVHVSLDQAIVMTDTQAEEIIELDEALDRLAAFDERAAQIVECRFFGGMTIADTATVLNVSPMTVKRGWTMAQAWLYREIRR